MNTSKIPCGNEWMDCEYYDPDICDIGECVLEDAVLWDDNYDQNTENNYDYA